MTDEQINETITEVTGLWDHPYSSDTKRMYDFCSDLNAMHEAEKGLSSEQEKDYFANIKVTVGDHIWYRTVGRSYRATARQRAEAFLKALGKWEEAQK